MSNPELARNSEAEIFCERIIKEIPYSRPLIEVFREFTFSDSQKVSGNKIIGKSMGKFGLYRPIMCLKWEEKYPEVTLSIYEGDKKDISNLLEDVRFRAGLITGLAKFTEKNFDLIAEFTLKRLSLPSEYLKFLNMVENEINKRAFNSQNSQRASLKTEEDV